MKPQAIVARIIWAAICLTSAVAMIASIPLRYAQLTTLTEQVNAPTGQLRIVEARALNELGLSLTNYAAYFTLLEVVSGTALFALGVFVFAKRSDDRMAWLSSLAMVTFGLTGSPFASALEQSTPAWGALVLALRLLGLTAFILSFLVFPDGRFVPAWTRWLAAVWLLYIVAALFVPALRVTASIVWADSGQALVFAWAVVWLITIVGVQVYRYRRYATPIQKVQSRWVVFGLATTIGLMVASIIPVVLLTLGDAPLNVILVVRLVAFTIILLASVLLPITFAVAVLRYRLYDINVIVHRTLVYGVLTLALTVLYFLSVIVLQRLFSTFSGGQSPLVVVASTLLIAALFNPLRRRIQTVVDRRFFRSKYDAQQVLTTFALTARDETDLDVLTMELARVVEETMQPSQVSVILNKRMR